MPSHTITVQESPILLVFLHLQSRDSRMPIKMPSMPVNRPSMPVKMPSMSSMPV